jgi:GrpB-like predicted nucleotidyltransferase (UPF0157 family)
MVKFRDHLRGHDDTRDAYQMLKVRLEQENKAGIGEYLDAKEPFIRAVLASVETTEVRPL